MNGPRLEDVLILQTRPLVSLMFESSSVDLFCQDCNQNNTMVVRDQVINAISRRNSMYSSM